MNYQPNRNSDAGRTVVGIKSFIVSVTVNTLLAIIKIMTGILGHSYALVADGIESLTDIFTASVVYSGIKVSSIPPDYNHPYGHGKAESLSAFIVALVLMGAAILIFVQAVKEIVQPHYTPEPYTLFVLIFVIFTKEFLFRFLLKKSKTIDSLSMEADAWHTRSDALTSLAALIGISIALVGGEGFEGADDWAAIFASGLILFNGSRMLKSSVDELMDAQPPDTIEKEIRIVAGNVAGVFRVEKCLVRKSGPGYHAEVHIEVDGGISVEMGHTIAHQVKDSLLASKFNFIDVVVHVEPYHGG